MSRKDHLQKPPFDEHGRGHMPPPRVAPRLKAVVKNLAIKLRRKPKKKEE